MRRSSIFVLFLGLALASAFAFAPEADAEPVWKQSLRPDGSAIDWAIDMPAVGTKHGLIVIAQGSGCLPVAQSHNIAAVRQAFAEFTALTVEKYGIAPGMEIADPFESCPAAYHAHNTASQRVADYRQILSELADTPWWDGTLVLFGGSMGGSVMARLAPDVDADAAIFLSTGGGVTFGEMILQTVPEEARPALEAQFEAIRAQSDSTEVWLGYSFRFWADSIDHREVDDMLRTDAQLLLVQGGRDASTPVGIARGTADFFAASDRSNLTYWEYAGYDHGMTDQQDRSHMDEVIEEIAGWVDTVIMRPRQPLRPH